MSELKGLITRYAQAGRLDWIGIRPGRRLDLVPLEDADLDAEGLVGDHGTSVKRAVTLVQAEHLAVIGAFLGRGPVEPGALRRNLVVSGINLLGLRHREVRIGETVLEITGLCAPCSRMEAAFGHGGYAAVRGHGGVTARVVVPGRISVDDIVVPRDLATDQDGTS